MTTVRGLRVFPGFLHPSPPGRATQGTGDPLPHRRDQRQMDGVRLTLGAQRRAQHDHEQERPERRVGLLEPVEVVLSVYPT
jgi:hypothetical protein